MNFTRLLLVPLFLISSAVYAQDATPDVTPTVAIEATPEATEYTPAAPPGSERVETFQGSGGYTLLIGSQGIDRTVYIYIPSSYQAQTPAPLVIALHGAGGTGEGMAAYAGFNDLADAHGFIVAYPDGFNNAWNDNRPDRRTIQVDDLGFIRALITFLEDHLTIDGSRIYATGHSMGGMMAYRLGCQMRDRIAAVAAVGTTLPTYLLEPCLFADPVPVMIIQGTYDEVIPAAGVTDPVLGRIFLSAEDSARYWAELNGCAPGYRLSALPDTVPGDGTRTFIHTYADCEGASSVVLYLIIKGGHTWPGHQIMTTMPLGKTSYDLDATQVIWDYFSEHTLP